jgi:hypothetical protein
MLPEGNGIKFDWKTANKNVMLLLKDFKQVFVLMTCMEENNTEMTFARNIKIIFYFSFYDGSHTYYKPQGLERGGVGVRG